MNASLYPRLLGDVGGTHARFAWQDAPGTPLRAVASHLCKDHDSLLAAVEHHLSMENLQRPRACAIGIANPVTGDEVRMTNHHWSFSIDALRRALGVDRLVVINDFTALALALPGLPSSEFFRIGGGEGEPYAPVALIGPGTGLGVSGLLWAPGGVPVPISGEGGHVTLAAADDQEALVIGVLQRRFGHVSAERALSGPGLVNLYEAVTALDGLPPRVSAPGEVIEGARSGDAACAQALGHFCALLGSVAGNLALTLGARGGVYVGGGIAPRILPELEASRFRERFEDKGRFRTYLADIPTLVIRATVSPALAGAACALDASPPS